MFSVRALRFAAGQRLVAPFGTLLTFNVSDFYRLPDTYETYNVTWDFGDGVIVLLGDNVATTTHLYEEPGGRTLRLQVAVDGVIETLQWDLQVSCLLTDLTAGDPPKLSYLAAIHGSLTLPRGGVRHLVVPLPAVSAVASGQAYGTWTGTDTPDTDAATLALAIDNALERLQLACCLGFGRMAAPAGPMERGVFAHVAADVIPLGTQQELIDDLSLLEQHYREAEENPSAGHRLSLLADDLEDLVSLYASNMARVEPFQLVDAAACIAGQRSIRLGDVLRWRQYSQRGVSDQAVWNAMTVQEMRIYDAQYLDEAPRFHAEAAWTWELAQSVMQAVDAFYTAIAAPGGTGAAQTLVLADPQTGAVSVRLLDTQIGIWVQWNIAPVQGAADQLEWRDLLLEGGGSGRLKTGGFVAGRAVAMAYRGGTPAVRSPFDLQRARLVLEGRQQTEFAQLATAPTGLAAMSEDVGMTVCTYRDASGAARTVAEVASSWAVFDVVRPTVEAPSLRQAASAMRPHAAYQVWRDEAEGGGESAQSPGRPELQARTRTVRVGR